MKILTYILFSILLCSCCSLIISVIAGRFWTIGLGLLLSVSGSTLLVTLLLLFFSIRKTKVHFQLLDYLLTGINTTLPAAFLSCYLLYRWQNNGTFFTETILFLLLSMLGLAASVLFISFLKLSSK